MKKGGTQFPIFVRYDEMKQLREKKAVRDGTNLWIKEMSHKKFFSTIDTSELKI